MSIPSSAFNLYESWEIQPTKRRLCIGTDHLPYDYDIVPRNLIAYLSAFPELRRKKTINGVGNDGDLSVENESIKKQRNCKGKDEFQMCVNVSHFNPNEISVKVNGDDVVIECKHMEKEDIYGSMFRHIMKRFKLPEEYNIDHLQSSLSSDGILIVRAPKKSASSDTNERIVQIQQTGPAHLNIKENS